MGDDGNTYSDGNLQNGDNPIFKIYDVSNNTYFEAQASEIRPWTNNGTELMPSSGPAEPQSISSPSCGPSD